MSDTWAAEEAQWRQSRRELYDNLYRGGREGVNSEAVLAAREQFTPGKHPDHKPYTLPSEDDCVTLICAKVPDLTSRRWSSIGQEVMALLDGEARDGYALYYVNKHEFMHVTLFHTSHPAEFAPNAKSRCESDIAQLRAMAAGFKPFRMKPVRVLLASSGALIMVYECLPSSDATDFNQEFSVDHLRRVGKETFTCMPQTAGTRTIIHSTLARILEPNVCAEAVERVHTKCEELTQGFLTASEDFLVDTLWYVEETHHFSAKGKTTVVPIGGSPTATACSLDVSVGIMSKSIMSARKLSSHFPKRAEQAMGAASPFSPKESAWIGRHTAKLKNSKHAEKAWVKVYDTFAEKYPAPAIEVNATQFRAHGIYLGRKQARIEAATGKSPAANPSSHRGKPSAKSSRKLQRMRVNRDQEMSCLEFCSAAEDDRTNERKRERARVPISAVSAVSTNENQQQQVQDIADMKGWMMTISKQMGAVVGRSDDVAKCKEQIKQKTIEIEELQSRTSIHEKKTNDVEQRLWRLERRLDKLSPPRLKKLVVHNPLSRVRSLDALAEELESDEE